MVLNKQSGNMYPWITHTWNPIKGRCSHNCKYCYMKRFPQNDIHFDISELKTDLGSGNIIFVGSSCDIFANRIPDEWILKTLMHCYIYDNTYLFQTKNLAKLDQYRLPEKSIIGTTIETNREYNISNAPSVEVRMDWIRFLEYKKMVSIEPIMDFDLPIMVAWIEQIEPEFVSIGADSKGHNLPEPSSIKVKQLIKALNQITEVKQKNNLNRILQKKGRGIF